MYRGKRGALLACLLVAATGLHCRGKTISDTGFTGRWERSAGQSRSVVSIWEDDGSLHYCWSKWTAGEQSVRCTGPGESVVRSEGERVYRYTFRVRDGGADPEAPLTVEVLGQPLAGRSTPIQWVDRLELQSGGLELWSYQIELNGRPRPNPAGPYKFVKVDDRPR